MTDKNYYHKIHLLLWFAITMLTGILSGFLISHSVMLGRYFTWLIESGNYNVFVDTFSVFREVSNANLHYNLVLWASLIVGILWTIFCFILRKNRIVSAIAGLSSFWVGSVFFASGFASAEEAVCTGTANELVRNFFVNLNIPLHISFAAFYSICFLLLLISGVKSTLKENSHI
ncbi:MAG: hypothetical protein JW864_10435 [Spirochaetes bacterium]|nr:hypothetical protein [Spirochaetota bacterium]